MVLPQSGVLQMVLTAMYPTLNGQSLNSVGCGPLVLERARLIIGSSDQGRVVLDGKLGRVMHNFMARSCGTDIRADLTFVRLRVRSDARRGWTS